MIPNLHPGKFIVLEGIDGAGHTTQAALLADFLKEHGKEVLETKEPTDESEAAKRIRAVLAGKVQLSHQELQGLFIEDRREHLERVVEPALKRGTWVISDRYAFSTFAYGVAFGVDLNWMLEKSEHFLLPDVTLFLDISPDIAIARITQRDKPIVAYYEEKEKQAKIREAYHSFLEKFANVAVLNGEEEIKKVAENVRMILQKKFEI